MYSQHTHIHTRVQAHIQTHVRAQLNMHAHTFTCQCMNVCTHKYIHPLSHVLKNRLCLQCINTLTQRHTCTHEHAYTHRNTCTPFPPFFSNTLIWAYTHHISLFLTIQLTKSHDTTFTIACSPNNRCQLIFAENECQLY